jgi:hypothetical protein
MSLYTLSAHPFLFLQDSPDRLDFHIRSGDYFSFIATKLGFIEEAIKKCDASSLSKEEQGIPNELRRDLRYVQAHYKIVPRDGSEIGTIRPSGDLFSK